MKKIALLAALAFAGSAQADMIDNFNSTGAFDLNAPQAGTAVGSASGSFGALARTLTSTTSGTDTNVQIDTVTNVGVYAHSQSASVSGTSYIEYTMADLDLNNNLTAFRVKLTQVDLAGSITVYANDGTNSSTVSLTTNTILTASGLAFPAYADFLFSDFAGVDFNSINVVRLGVNGSTTTALDAVIDEFETVCSALTSSGGSGKIPGTGNCNPTPPSVPEPATLGLLGLGLLGLGAMRRRKA